MCKAILGFWDSSHLKLGFWDSTPIEIGILTPWLLNMRFDPIWNWDLGFDPIWNWDLGFDPLWNWDFGIPGPPPLFSLYLANLHAFKKMLTYLLWQLKWYRKIVVSALRFGQKHFSVCEDYHYTPAGSNNKCIAWILMHFDDEKHLWGVTFDRRRKHVFLVTSWLDGHLFTPGGAVKM